MKIDFNNIYNQDRILFPKIIKDIKRLIQNNKFILGDEVVKFEKNLSKFTKTKYCVSCANGTDALYIVLKSLNLKKDDEVIVPDMTWIATASTVINNNCKLRLVDVSIKNGSIDQLKVIKKINSKTKAIIAVNLWGYSANYKKLKKICNKKKILLIEDAAQSIGSINSEGLNSGNLGHVACFSFFPGKNLGAYGDAGAIVTNDKKIYQIVKKIRSHGAIKKFNHEIIGTNSRLDTIQAAILNRKLKRINLINKNRRRIAKFYFDKIKNKKIYLFDIFKRSSFHQFVVLVKERNKLVKYLKKNNIPYGFHYPYSLHQLKPIKKYCNDKNFDTSKLISSRCISLPIDPMLNIKQLDYIVKKINLF